MKNCNHNVHTGRLCDYDNTLVFEMIRSILPNVFSMWITDDLFEILHVSGTPFDSDVVFNIKDAYSSQLCCNIMLKKHQEALDTGSSSVNLQHNGCIKHIVLMSYVCSLEPTRKYIACYSTDSTQLINIYNTLLEIRENSFSLYKNSRIRLLVDNLLEIDIFKTLKNSCNGSV